MNNKPNIIGTGWAFPPAFDPVSQTPAMVSGEQNIVQSLRTLFGTQPGERVLELAYGCDLSSLLFRNISLSQKTILENRIQRAVLLFEPRIKLAEIEVDINQLQDGVIRILLGYVLQDSNSRANRVFPFFIKEGTLIPDF